MEIGTPMKQPILRKLAALALVFGAAVFVINPTRMVAQSASPSPTPAAPDDLSVNPQPSGPDMPAPDLWDIATGEHIPAAEVLKTKDFGARVKDFDYNTPASRNFLQGDIILAVNNFRVYGGHEYTLARNRDPFSSSLSYLVNRNGDLLWVKLHNLQPGHRIGLRTDWRVDCDRFPAAIESLGLPAPDEKTLPALQLLPARAAAELYLWDISSPSAAAANTAWLKDFIDLYLAVEGRHYSDAHAPNHQPPIPYFQRLEKFYLALAAANQPKETLPDASKTGESPEFYVLAMPIPICEPPLGELHFTDLRFNSLLSRAYATSESGSDAEVVAAAAQYANKQADGIERYLNYTKAALLNPVRFNDLLYANRSVADSFSRKLLIQAISGLMSDQGQPDWPLNAAAMIALKFRNGDFQDAAGLLDALGKRSPWLALSVAQNARHHVSLAPGKKRFATIRKVLNRTNFFFGGDLPEAYRWTLETVTPIAVAAKEIGPWDETEPYHTLTNAAYAELSALKAAAPSASSSPAPQPVELSTQPTDSE
jgi:hypothetical protein